MTQQTARFLVTGKAASGKSSFIRSAAGNLSADGNHGEVVVNQALRIELFAADAPPESDAWRDVLEGVIGVVLLVDGTQPKTFADVPQIIETITAVNHVPFIIAVNKQDVAGWHPPKAVRDHLPEDSEIKVFPCIATDPTSAQNVLLALIYSLLS
jgi:hypothetical protein